MAHKENKGGLLTNEEVDQDLKAKGRTENPNGYSGVQDSGDKTVRQIGTKVQKADGAPDGESALQERD